MHKQHKVRIYCPVTCRTVSVFLSTLDYQDVHLIGFDGCESNFNGSTICKQCGARAKEIFSQTHDISKYEHLC